MNHRLKHTVAFLLSALLSTQSNAEPLVNTLEPQWMPWSITTSLGMGHSQYMEGLRGQTALGRLSFDFAMTHHFGLEVGIQNGSQMRFAVPKTTLDILGGVPIEGTMRPILDGLITAKTAPFNSTTPVYAQVKAGIAYRQLQMDRETINDRAGYAPEFQAGIGYKISERLDISLMAQHIAGKNPNIQADAVTETGRIAHIPTQQALLFGLKITLE